MGPELQTGKLRPYVADLSINLWGSDLLQQWSTQMNIPASLGAANKDVRGDMVDTPGEGIDTGVGEQSPSCAHDQKPEQAVIERANGTLKEMLIKQRGRVKNPGAD